MCSETMNKRRMRCVQDQKYLGAQGQQCKNFGKC
jgi:hypothetical protein